MAKITVPVEPLQGSRKQARKGGSLACASAHVAQALPTARPKSESGTPGAQRAKVGIGNFLGLSLQ